MCFSPYLGVGGGGGAPQGPRAQPAYVVFQPRQLKNGRSSPLFEVPIVLCGPLKRPMDLLGPTGACGDLWGPMGACGGQWGLWGPMGAYGDLWGPVGAFGDLWDPMGTYGGLWGITQTTFFTTSKICGICAKKKYRAQKKNV